MNNPMLLLAPSDAASATFGTDTVRALGRTFGIGRPVPEADRGSIDIAVPRVAVAVPAGVVRRLRSAYGFVAGFYSRPLSWTLFVVSTVVLVYGGGAVMFWFHAIYLGELGPNIHPVVHWALDSTLGLIGLTPPLLAILPMSAGAARWIGARARWYAIRPGTCAVIGGILFAAVTAPGPLVHDALVGRGTWLATRVERVVGTYGSAVPVHHHLDVPAFAAMAQQFGVGVPVYVVLLWASLQIVRLSARAPGGGRRTAWRLGSDT
jgi:hypothetical protein